MGMQMVSACVYPHASLQCRCVASLWERARTTPKRCDMGRALESETGPRQGPYCIGVGRAPGPLPLCYVVIRIVDGASFQGLYDLATPNSPLSLRRVT